MQHDKSAAEDLPIRDRQEHCDAEHVPDDVINLYGSGPLPVALRDAETQ